MAPFTFSHTVSGGFNGVFYGIILGVTSYIGFETAVEVVPGLVEVEVAVPRSAPAVR